MFWYISFHSEFSVWCFHICVHIKFFLFVIFSLENYYVQGFVILCLLQTFNKICFFVIIFFVFIIWLFLYTPILHFLSWSAVFYKVSYFVIFVTLPSFFFLFSTILYHVFIYIVVEAPRLFVFIIVVFSLSNVYKCFSFSLSYFWSHSVILSTFYGFIFVMIQMS